jgi:glycosyltransferase involved in cell wall biosynthesis
MRQFQYSIQTIDFGTFNENINARMPLSPIILYGIGTNAVHLTTRYLNFHKELQIKYWCDFDERVWGKRFLGNNIISPQTLRDIYNGELIVIATEFTRYEICDDLISLGIPKENIMILPFTDITGSVPVPTDDFYKTHSYLPVNRVPNKPRVTVATTLYNTPEKYFRRCIESVLNQTYSDFTYLIFDNGTTDSTLDILNEYMSIDNRIKYIRLGDNDPCLAGISGFLNIELVETPYFTSIDSDDAWSPVFLERTLQTADMYGTDIVAASCVVCREPIDETDNPQCFFAGVDRDVVTLNKSDVQLVTSCLVYRHCVWGILYKTDIIKKFIDQTDRQKWFELFNPGIPDSTLVEQLAHLSERLVILSEVLYFNRRSQNAATGTNYEYENDKIILQTKAIGWRNFCNFYRVCTDMSIERGLNLEVSMFNIVQWYLNYLFFDYRMDSDEIIDKYLIDALKADKLGDLSVQLVNSICFMLNDSIVKQVISLRPRYWDAIAELKKILNGLGATL